MSQRVIKFRMWYKSQMLGPQPLSQLIEESDWYPRDVVVMQFTGLTDKLGIEIYEGDIIKWQPVNENYSPLDTDTGQIYWFDISWWLKGTQNEDFDYSLDVLAGQECEVIGNIYENPELLK